MDRRRGRVVGRWSPSFRRSWTPSIDVRIVSRRLNAFRVFGFGGFFLALVVGFVLTLLTHRSVGISFLFAATACAVFFALAWATKLFSGAEFIVYFHHEVAVLAAGVLILHLLQVPPLPYLDLAMIGIILFLGVGRIGCLRVGCCYGRPASFGVRYGTRHVESGFPEKLAGVILMPVQMIESFAGLAIAGIGVAFVLHSAPGSCLGWCASSYGAFRFFVSEPLRGDRRPAALGLSHAQWLAFVRAGALLGAIYAHVLRFDTATVLLAGAVCSAAAVRTGKFVVSSLLANLPREDDRTPKLSLPSWHNRKHQSACFSSCSNRPRITESDEITPILVVPLVTQATSISPPAGSGTRTVLRPNPKLWKPGASLLTADSLVSASKTSPQW